MSLDSYAQFMRAKGLAVIEAEGALWVFKRKLFLENIPPHRKLSLSAAATARLFLRGAAAIRYACDESVGRPSFEYVCSGKQFGLAELSSDARRRVRRGLESCEIRPVDFEYLAHAGWQVNQNTFARQGRHGVAWMSDQDLWRKYMMRCRNISGLYAYAAFVGQEFCGYSIAVTVDDYAYLYHTQAFSKFLKFSPINALTYTVTRAMLDLPAIHHVSQGLESFAQLPEVENFKLSMGFQKKSLGRRLVLHPLARPLFSPPAVWLANRALRKIRPDLAEDLSTFADSLRTPAMAPAANGNLSQIAKNSRQPKASEAYAPKSYQEQS